MNFLDNPIKANKSQITTQKYLLKLLDTLILFDSHRKRNEVLVDLTGKKSGRGAYLCKDKNCLKKAIKAKRLQSNLEVQISDELIESLSKELEGIE